ncbi:MAG: virulence associated protein [Thiotrichaceae bacterium]|nr:MAG: virulence associated protein [Thiotrichaceae bacterium]
MPPDHIALLIDDEPLVTDEGEHVEVWRIQTPDADDLVSWAKHVREHYCLDSEIDGLREGTGLSRSEYLTNLVFPDSTERPGPSVRAGDFTEILISDYLEYSLGYTVPRIKFAEKAVRNEPVKGVDVIGYMLIDEDGNNPDDRLVTYEVKAKLTGNAYDDTLQKAIDHSSKDFLRLAETLNFLKRKYKDKGQYEEANKIQRFQNKTDKSYIYESGAAAVITSSTYDEAAIVENTETVNHPNSELLALLVISGDDLMVLVHSIYLSAANDA